MAEQDLSKLKIEKTGTALRSRRRRPAVYLAAVLSIAIGIFVLYRFVLSPVADVEVSTVSLYYPSQNFTLLNASGYIVAQRKAAVASKATGTLEWIGVEEGSRVRGGEVIARLESEDVAAVRKRATANLATATAGLEEARAEREIAKLNVDRAKALLDKGFVARNDYDAAEARYKRAEAAVAGARAAILAAKAALESANVEVEYRLIRAPFDAVVLTKDADVGDIVTPLGAAANAKAAVVTIADLSSLQVEADVSESNLGRVNVGQPCEIQLDAIPGERFRGAVHMVVPTADRTKASVMVKVRFVDRDARILPEMSARVAFLERPVAEGEEKPKTGLSADAVVTKDGKDMVFVVRGDRVERVFITIGERAGDVIEVRTGIAAGERVVMRPPKHLKNGSRIKIREL